MNKKKEPIRIAQVIGKWLGGGVESVVMNYYRHIDKTKIQFDFICDSDSTNIPYEEIEKLGGKVILIPPYQKVFKYHKELKKVLKEGNYKIVHSHINTLSVFSLCAAWAAKVPVRIAHSHSTTNKREKKKNLIKLFLRPFSKLFATNYMACTEHAGKWMFGDDQFELSNVKVLNNAIDVEKFKFNEKIRKSIRKELNINDDTFVIGHIGRFVAQKNHDYLIDIFKEVYSTQKNSLLLLIGQGPLMDEIKEKVKNLGLEKNVMFLGQRDDVEKLYQAMDLFLFPSLYEGLGMVAIEAQASGCPCICSTEIPLIAKVSDIIDFVSLSDNLKEWCSSILKYSVISNRIDYNLQVKNSGYDIHKEVKKLEEYYLGKKIYFYSERWTNGGIEMFILNNASLMKKCAEISIITSQKESCIYDDKIQEYITNFFAFHDYIKNPFKRFLKNFILFKKHLYKINNVNDVFHINIYNGVGLFYAYLAKKKGIQNIVVHAHNTGIDNDKFKFKSLVHNIFKKIFTSRMYTYVACSTEAAHFCFDISKISFKVLNNAIDVEKFKFNEKIRKSIRKELNINDDTFVIGHIGRFVAQKNHDYLIDIFKEVYSTQKNSLLLLIGQGPLMDEIKEKVKNLGLEKNVMFLGQRDDVEKLYQAMDCFVLPSSYEGLGIVVIEAQASGCPCIVSDKVPQIVRCTNNIEFLPTNNEMINQWKKVVLSSKNLNDRTIGYFDVKNSDYSYKKFENMLIEIYKF